LASLPSNDRKELRMNNLAWQDPKVNKSWGAIDAKGLTHHLQELLNYGLTIIPPEAISIDNHLERMRDAVLRIAEEQTGVEHVIETGQHGSRDVMGTNESQYLLYAFLEKDPVFEEVITCPQTLPLIEYFLGQACQLSSLTAFVKWKGAKGYGEGLGLHNDSGLAPQPLPPNPPVFNTNWILTDYTKENGAFCIVPGTHKLCRHPGYMEGVERAVPVEAPAGSVLVFHGYVWHGAFPKLTDGLRLSVNAYYCGQHYRAQESFHGRITQEMLARNPDRFASLVGQQEVWGFSDERGPIPFDKR
jgi:ectoine hydroxylase-related dioxygenase (phytanoyl-CoA dioxygenase family)